MNRTTRTLLFAAALMAVPLLVPAATAADADGGDDGDAKGEKFCERVAGINACVAVLHGDCTLWVSASFGGCFIRDDGLDANSA